MGKVYKERIMFPWFVFSCTWLGTIWLSCIKLIIWCFIFFFISIRQLIIVLGIDLGIDFCVCVCSVAFYWMGKVKERIMFPWFVFSCTWLGTIWLSCIKLIIWCFIFFFLSIRQLIIVLGIDLGIDFCVCVCSVAFYWMGKVYKERIMFPWFFF